MLDNSVKFLEAANIIRLIRISIYLEEIRAFRLILQTLLNLLTPFWSLLSVMFSIFYIYALIGMFIFEGRVDF